MSYLLDTNVVSELIKKRKNPGVLDWLASTSTQDHHVSVMSIGELRRGITRLELRNDHIQAERYEHWLVETVRIFADRIVPVSTEVAEHWGRRDAAAPIPIVDGLIGATAAVRGWTLVTRNIRDFRHVGVELLNPFSA